MTTANIEQIQGHWYASEIWREEEGYVKELLRIPPITFTKAVFATPGQKLPYWNMPEDAKRHAIYSVRKGVEGVYRIASDYRETVLANSRETIMDGHEYDQMVRRLLDGLLNSDLPVMTEKFIRSRFGLDDKPRTYLEAGAEFNLTAKQANTLETKALRLLRHPSRSKIIDRYLQERRRVFLKYLYESGIMTEDL